MGTTDPWKYDGHNAFLRIKRVLRERHSIDPDRHGQGKIAAGKVGASQSAWSNWATERGAPIDALGAIAQRLGVNVAFLLGLTDEMGQYGEPDAPELQNAVSAQLNEIRSHISQILARLTDLERAS